jgi:hypothetical protein
VHIGQIDKLPSRDVLSGGIKQTMDGFGEITLQYLSFSRGGPRDKPLSGFLCRKYCDDVVARRQFLDKNTERPVCLYAVLSRGGEKGSRLYLEEHKLCG